MNAITRDKSVPRLVNRRRASAEWFVFSCAFPGCPFELHAEPYVDDDGQVMVRITEHHGHYGHIPGSEEDNAWRERMHLASEE